MMRTLRPKRFKIAQLIFLSASTVPLLASRGAEIVKAYPAGRYTDPHFPETMHERHTLYRREQAAEWNIRPSNTYALPLGPVIAESNPSPSYYVATDGEQRNAQQKAYAEAEPAHPGPAKAGFHDSGPP